MAAALRRVVAPARHRGRGPLAAYAIPVSLAYATLAGLPPQYGIYCYLVAGPAYALFGTSRQLAIGPTSAISMLVGATLLGMAEGDPQRWAAIAALCALIFATVSVLAWCRLPRW
jgi:MFS superfamily sulfate permease-like transporter